MSSPAFEAPGLEQLAALLPAYDFEAFIAQGGMGAVYKARQRSLDRDVAIKILPRELGQDPEFRESFTTEARAMARLNHPNLIGVYDSGDVDGMPYIVMEYVNGKSLYHSAYNIAVDPREAVEIILGICRGLGHAHENGVIHRDIKPANILLNAKKEPKIGDFGLARPAGHGGPGLVMGTPGYTAPEILQHPDHADRRSDLFAVGVILFELLTGQRPPESGPLPLPSSVSQCDTRLDAICQKSTHPNPDLRYPSAEALAEALESWLKASSSGPRAHAARNRPPRALATGGAPAQRALVTGGAPPPRAGVTDTLPDVPPRSNTVRNLVLLAVLVAAIPFSWKFLQKAKNDRDAENLRIQNEAKAQAAREEEAKKAEAERIAQENARKQNPHANESPAESLSRLKSALAAGDRSEWPKGSVLIGNSAYFFVPDAMTWLAAAAFAEEHGAHLAIATSDDDLTRFRNFFSKEHQGTEIWLGSGRSGRNWANVDGTPWSLSSKPLGVGSFASLDGSDIVRARKEDSSFPFILQWHEDGSNPATLEAVLKHTAGSLGSATPSFPPGAVAYGARHYLVIDRPVTAAEAHQLAKTSGGHLVVTADRDEAGWLSDHLKTLPADRRYWIGASRSGQNWKWTTGETWEFTGWAPGSPTEDGDAALFVAGKGWSNAPADSTADGLIIEWSSDRDSATEAPDESSNHSGSPGNSEAEALLAKAKELLKNLDDQREKDLAANLKKLNWDLDTLLRDLPQGEAARWRREIESLRALFNGNRIPRSIPDDADVRLSDRMTKLYERALEKQSEIDSRFKSNAVRIRDAYVTRIRDAAKAASEKGQTAAAGSLEAIASQAMNLDLWLENLGFGSGAFKSTSSLSPASLEGKWSSTTVSNNVITFVKDGTCSSKRGDSGTWEIRDAGSGETYRLHIKWKSGYSDSLNLVEEGKVLEGVNNNDQKVRYIRETSEEE